MAASTRPILRSSSFAGPANEEVANEVTKNAATNRRRSRRMRKGAPLLERTLDYELDLIPDKVAADTHCVRERAHGEPVISRRCAAPSDATPSPPSRTP